MDFKLKSGAFSDSDSADIVFLIHASKNTNNKDFKKLMKYLGVIAQRPDIKKNKIGIVFYGPSAETVLELTEFKKVKLLAKAFRKIKGNKRFKTADLVSALSFVREHVFNGKDNDDPARPNGIVLVRDQGAKKVNTDNMRNELSLLHANAVNIFQIGIGDNTANDTESTLVKEHYGDSSSSTVSSYNQLVGSRHVVDNLSSKFRSFREFM